MLLHNLLVSTLAFICLCGFCVIILQLVTGQGNKVFIFFYPFHLISYFIDLFGKWQIAIRSYQLRSPLTHFSFFCVIGEIRLPLPLCSVNDFICPLFLLRDSGTCFLNEAHTHHMHTYKFHNKPQWSVLIKSINYNVCMCVKNIT